MAAETIFDDIAAVTDEEMTFAELPESEGDNAVGEPVTDHFLKQVATLYYAEVNASAQYWKNVDRDTISEEQSHINALRNLRLAALGAIFDLKLQEGYGKCLSKKEREDMVILEITMGWRVRKIGLLGDEQAEGAQTSAPGIPKMLN
ncbi:MAG TPA: hypothetical protein VG984_03385 [Candidatus Paceibacterota bacterium]|nr:hypothetical protein [Candidatus Paceibacterota bacterium]